MGNVPPGFLPENYESLVPPTPSALAQAPPSAQTQAPPSAQAQAQAPRPPPSEATSAGNMGEWWKTDGKIISIKDRLQDKWDDKSKFFKDSNCNTLVVVEFCAQWSGPSRFISPFIKRLAEANKNVLFLRVNYDSMEEVASEEGVDVVVPTYLLFKGGQLKEKIVGANRFKLSAKINELK